MMNNGVMTPANDEVVQTMQDALFVNLLLVSLGLLCAVINAPSLYVLLASKNLRDDSKLLICLEIADVVNCLALSLMGYSRFLLYNRSIVERMVPLETSLSCASKPYVWLRVIGSIWPSTVQMMIGIERVIATTWPMVYIKHLRNRSTQLCVFTVAFVILFCMVGLVLAIFNVNKGYVKFDCGRRATFTVLYAQAIYFWEMQGYIVGLFLNIIAYVKAKSRLTNTIVRDQLKRTRICLALGALSAVLVSVMDVKSLFFSHLLFVEENQLMAHFYNCVGVLKASMNTFMYIWLHKEFRRELFKLLRFRRQHRAVNVVEVNHNIRSSLSPY